MLFFNFFKLPFFIVSSNPFTKSVLPNKFFSSFINKNKNIFSFTSILVNHTIMYPTPATISYFWNFGSLAAFCLFIQISTGIFLAMHYNPDISLAFSSVEHIMRDVNGGWFLRYAHANGASAFFAVVYLHIFRALLYRSFSFAQIFVWLSGVVIFILMMATAFIGYVLPWGQMSFWGATVITNLFSVIPFVGPDLVYWIWGGFSVGAATLNRFYALHYAFPFLIVAVVFIHLYFLHKRGSSNPFSFEHREITSFYLPLYPYFLIKDFFGLIIFSLIFSYFLFWEPNLLGHSDNYIPANPLVTPEHIVPEWYFLPFYAILRSIPNKVFGIIAMGGALVFFFLLPLEHYFITFGGFINKFFGWKENSQVNFNSTFFHTVLVSCFGAVFVMLGFIGARPVAEPYIFCGQISTVLYFVLLGNFAFTTPNFSTSVFKNK